MLDAQPVTVEYFCKRLVALCLRSGLTGLPRDDLNRHILLKSVVLTFDKASVFTEKEINARLQDRIEKINGIRNIDHITLRRLLIDTGYLARNSDGSRYRVSLPGPRRVCFDKEIDKLDIVKIIEDGRNETARRKREYMQAAKQKKKNTGQGMLITDAQPEGFPD